MIGVWAVRPLAHGAKSHGPAQRNVSWFVGVELLLGSEPCLWEKVWRLMILSGALR